ncbi:MAG: sugar phosphorylase [Desulfonauticus sp.]|nr:sugar phosphorylase [Desulfonauticus sp.]
MWRLPYDFKNKITKRLTFLYGEEKLHRLLERIGLFIARYYYLREKQPDTTLWDEKSNILITYPDMIKLPGEKPLTTLNRFLVDYLSTSIESVHILPFFPYTSDEGFSIIDYKQVSPHCGEWEDIEELSRNFRLMFDLVLNHVSRCSNWFQDYLSGIAPALNYFIEVDPNTDLSMVIRPRTSPLLTKVKTVFGERYVWTTFSPDQIDLNYQCYDLLMEILEVLLFYITKGAKIIRLDAIAYLWKKIGTTCLNLPETHEVVKLFRDIVDHLAPGTIILTETNLPHDENISYFGNGDEAHMVYQFALPPLLLYTLHKGNASTLSNWAKTVSQCPPQCTFLNFTASHDGIGVRPLESLISEEEINELVHIVHQLGGLVSYRQTPQGAKPYELNITYFDALKDLHKPENLDWQIKRFFCSQIIMLGLKGIPGIYFHNLIGSSNYYEGVQKTGQNRAINRQRLDDRDLREQLNNPDSKQSKIFNTYQKLLQIRKKHSAFHPDAAQEVLDLGEAIFAFKRKNPESQETIYCIHNITDKTQKCQLPKDFCFAKDLLANIYNPKTTCQNNQLTLEPYQCCWLINGRQRNEK